MHEDAIAHLTRADPKLGVVIARVGPCTFAPVDHFTHYEMLLRAIVFQQLSTKAATTIFDRFRALYGGRLPAPDELLATPDAALRGAGLSTGKTRYVKDLATHVRGGTLPIDTLHQLPDDAIIEALVAVKGVGVWTAHMFLLFHLGRPDVLPSLDLGVRKGVQRALGLRALPSPERVLQLGRAWAPYRSIAAWYMWRLLDHEGNPPQKRKKAKPKPAKKPARRSKPRTRPRARPRARPRGRTRRRA